MKSRVKIPPELRRECEKYVQKAIMEERAFIATSILTACVASLYDSFGFGQKRCQRFATGAYKKINEYFTADPDVWQDLAKADCERCGIRFDGYWVKPDDPTVIPELTKEQKEYLEECRTYLPTDEESRKVHSGAWKIWKGSKV